MRGLPYIIGGRVPKFTLGVIGVGIYHGAYISEVIRTGIEAVPKGQFDAAYSQGFNYLQTMRYIILPQTMKMILPPAYQPGAEPGQKHIRARHGCRHGPHVPCRLLGQRPGILCAGLSALRSDVFPDLLPVGEAGQISGDPFQTRPRSQKTGRRWRRWLK